MKNLPAGTDAISGTALINHPWYDLIPGDIDPGHWGETYKWEGRDRLLFCWQLFVPFLETAGRIRVHNVLFGYRVPAACRYRCHGSRISSRWIQKKDGWIMLGPGTAFRGLVTVHWYGNIYPEPWYFKDFYGKNISTLADAEKLAWSTSGWHADTFVIVHTEVFFEWPPFCFIYIFLEATCVYSPYGL